jgi:hypothetical protein
MGIKLMFLSGTTKSANHYTICLVPNNTIEVEKFLSKLAFLVRIKILIKFPEKKRNF